MPRFNPFRFLSSPRRRLQRLDDVSRPPSVGWGPRQWVLARSLCLYRTVVLGDVPPGERAGALDMRIRQWSPFAETGSYVVWEKETAGVWVWDEAVRKKAMAGAGIRKARVLPETILRPRPEEDGLRLAACLEGVDAQIWENRALMASRWWKEAPPDNEWAKFLLANDLPPHTRRPEARELPWLNRPWAGSALGKRGPGLRHERFLVVLAAMIFISAFIFQGVTLWKWREGVRTLEEKAAAMTTEIEPHLAARMRAMDELAAAEKLASLAPYPPQLQVMAGVVKCIPPNQARLVEWQYNQGRLTFTLQGKNLDPRYYVKAYQEMVFFSDVTAERGRSSDDLVIEMNVLPTGSKP